MQKLAYRLNRRILYSAEQLFHYLGDQFKLFNEDIVFICSNIKLLQVAGEWD